MNEKDRAVTIPEIIEWVSAVDISAGPSYEVADPHERELALQAIQSERQEAVIKAIGATLTERRDLAQAVVDLAQAAVDISNLGLRVLSHPSFNAASNNALSSDAQLKELGMSPREANLLAKHGIDTIEQLVGYRKKDLMVLTHFGPSTISNVRAFLRGHGLDLRLED